MTMWNIVLLIGLVAALLVGGVIKFFIRRKLMEIEGIGSIAVIKKENQQKQIQL